MNLKGIDAAERKEPVIGTVSGFPTPFCGGILFGGQPGDECHCWWPEHLSEVDWVAWVEGDNFSGWGDIVGGECDGEKRAQE